MLRPYRNPDERGMVINTTPLLHHGWRALSACHIPNPLLLKINAFVLDLCQAVHTADPAQRSALVQNRRGAPPVI